MEDYNGYETVKERLILAGISELQKHSIEDLSLRKVATLCNVSCAAPYKHFKNKEEFIQEIVAYINIQWTKLRQQVIEIYSDNKRTQLIEVCIAYIKFCAASPSFRNIMVMTRNSFTEKKQKHNFHFIETENLIRSYCMEHYANKTIAEKKILLLHSLVYGTVLMIENEELVNSKVTIEKVRELINEQLN